MNHIMKRARCVEEAAVNLRKTFSACLLSSGGKLLFLQLICIINRLFSVPLGVRRLQLWLCFRGYGHTFIIPAVRAKETAGKGHTNV